MAMTIRSPAFADGERIPVKYTADGANISPPLRFDGVPEGSAELALVCHDPDAPGPGGFTHWVAYGMAPGIDGLPEGVPPTATVDKPSLTQGRNSAGRVGYRGPSPPPGRPHRYQFRLYALARKLQLDAGASKEQLEAAMAGAITEQALLTGMYGR
ncbi:MAG: YbhB/YbcL family Raf kinase inhibitor-like protein [Armatimonadota bacterium]